MAKQSKESRFASLRTLREERQRKEQNNSESPDIESKSVTPKQSDPFLEKKSEEVQTTHTSSQENPTPNSKLEISIPSKRGPGRPRGRRSNPDYTQISAYIPLDLLLAVQDELANERRENRQRTARPVSDLVEELLGEWLKNQKSN